MLVTGILPKKTIPRRVTKKETGVTMNILMQAIAQGSMNLRGPVQAN